MNDTLITIIIITCILIFQNAVALVVFSYESGRDYIITGNKGKRLNKIEKLIDGYRTYKN